ncbi:hypothetical protein NL676_038996 [Syzygium grande]|nr:hypothetical protein NL676_038996 [Syzygium grande]
MQTDWLRRHALPLTSVMNVVMLMIGKDNFSRAFLTLNQLGRLQILIAGRRSQDWLRFSFAFWHTFRGTGGDPFGAATKFWPREDGTNSLAMAKRRMRANFQFLKKLGVDRWCFHDKNTAPDGKTLQESNADLDEVVALASEKSRIRGQQHVSFGQLCCWNNNLTR